MVPVMTMIVDNVEVIALVVAAAGEAAVQIAVVSLKKQWTL